MMAFANLVAGGFSPAQLYLILFLFSDASYAGDASSDIIGNPYDSTNVFRCSIMP